MDAVEKTNRINRLLDFYGDLLNERPRDYIKHYYAEDLSLAEIAVNAAVSRQAVLASIQRTEKQLENYETQLKLLSRDEKRGKVISQLTTLLADQPEAQMLLEQLNNIDAED
jgi:predicted DNA-binding protein YlxM (UPF0122 family)